MTLVLDASVAVAAARARVSRILRGDDVILVPTLFCAVIAP